ncbi:kinase-like protein [Clavulina sp. PMI_390]|nr:kinase-like protein [Clavulina sp. PMI_390]
MLIHTLAPNLLSMSLQLVHRQAIIHSRLHHPNIIPFRGIFHEDVNFPPMMILPFMQRGSLEKLLDGSPLQPDAFKPMLLRISKGVDYLHSQRPSIIHGDLHPGNVLIDDEGNPLLCDFGLSRIQHEVTRTLTLQQEAGMLRFLAPELSDALEGSFRTSRASDIFSLAMMFLNIWSGRKPYFEVPNTNKVAANFRKGKRPEEPTKGVSITPQLKRHLWDLINEMWDQQPNKRPSSNSVVARLKKNPDDEILVSAPAVFSLHEPVTQTIDTPLQSPQPSVPAMDEVGVRELHQIAPRTHRRKKKTSRPEGNRRKAEIGRFKCDEAGCTSVYNQMKSLNMHRRWHNTLRHICSGCGMSFPEAEGLIRHGTFPFYWSVYLGRFQSFVLFYSRFVAVREGGAPPFLCDLYFFPVS